MALTRLVLAWAIAALCFWGWELAARRVRRTAGAKESLDVAPGVLILEGLWLALVTTLWFASLGRGGWWLVLPLLALTGCWTPIMGRLVRLPPAKRLVAVATAVGRIVLAGTAAAAVL